MHVQAGNPRWDTAIALLPAHNAVVKSVANPSTLMLARERWVAAGRDLENLWTIFRHDEIRNAENVDDWSALKAHWRAQYFKAIDRTYLENYAAHARLVEAANEHSDDDMANGLKPADMRVSYRNTLASVEVWNTEFRGRWVNSPDGGRGFIPADCRLVIGNVPVGNDIPKSFYELAVAHDCVLGIHPYTKVINGQIDPQTWRYHSGRWEENEQRYGIFPDYAATECGPYWDAHHGWRSPLCCGHDENLLLQAMEEWWTELVTTDAYRERRLLGAHGCWFTIGGGDEWKQYELEIAQTEKLAKSAAQILLPVEDDMNNPAVKAKIRAMLAEVSDLLDAERLVRVRRDVPVLNVRAGPGVTFPDVGDVHALDELAVYTTHTNGWVKIHPRESRWISGSPAYVEPVV